MTTFVMLHAEFRRTLRLARSYWLEYLSDFLLYLFGYLLLIVVFTAGSESYGPEGYLSTLIGYITWKIGASALVDIAKIAAEEARTGTLEQLDLTGWGLGRVFLGRAGGILANYTIRGLVLGLALGALLGILQPVSGLAFAVFLITLMGACGCGFALAGLALVYKRIEGTLHLLWQMLVFFTGALAPLINPYLAAVSKVLPLSWGIEALRAVIIEGADLAALWQSGILQGLLLNTLVYVILGIAFFLWGQRQARLLGVMAHY